MSRAKGHHNHLAILAGTIANTHGDAVARRTTGKKRGFVQYWKRKLNEPDFHAGEVGGARNVKFDQIGQESVVALLAAEVIRNPRQTLRELAGYLHNQGYDVDVQFVWRLMHDSGFSKKLGAYVKINKFQTDNVLYWVVWVTNVIFLPVTRVKYLDEAHFDDGDLKRTEGWTPAGEALATVTLPPLRHSYTAFAVTSLTAPRGFRVSRPHTGRNNSVHFIRFILDLFISATVTVGDYLVADSAPIHTSQLSLRFVTTLCDFVGVRFLFLPKYSPELNPVELIWGFVKNRMRNRRGTDTFGNELVRAFASIDRELVKSFYRHCLYSWFQDDDDDD